jgi:hypothetical protein
MVYSLANLILAASIGSLGARSTLQRILRSPGLTHWRALARGPPLLSLRSHQPRANLRFRARCASRGLFRLCPLFHGAETLIVLELSACCCFGCVPLQTGEVCDDLAVLSEAWVCEAAKGIFAVEACYAGNK